MFQQTASAIITADDKNPKELQNDYFFYSKMLHSKSLD